MLEDTAKLVKWGNSFGIRIPKGRLKKLGIKTNQEVSFIILNKRVTRVKDIFGKLKFKSNTDKLLKEVDKELW